MKGNVINLNTLHLNSVRLNGIGKVQSVSLKGGSTEDPVFPPVEPPIEPEPTPTYTLSASVANGVVSATLNGVVVSLPYVATEGDVIVVEVTPNDGYEFNGWADGNTDNPRSITMNADVALSAQCVEVVAPSKYIAFADAEVERVLMANGVSSDGIGITKEDAAKVTSIGTWFNGNTAITSFDEFKYFTGVTTLSQSIPSTAVGAFYNCTNLQSITIPSSVTKILSYTFNKCSSLSSVSFEDASKITEIGDGAFIGSAISGDIAFVNLEKISNSFQSTNIERVMSLGKVTTINGVTSGYTQSLFSYCENLTFVHLPKTLTELIGFAIGKCASLTTIVCSAVTPPVLSNAAFNGTALTSIYVPDASLEAYKTATNWNTYADRIKPLSGYDNLFIHNGVTTYSPMVQIITKYRGEVVKPQYSVNGNATIDADGLLTFNGGGVVIVTATYNGMTATKNIEYIVTPLEQGVSLRNDGTVQSAADFSVVGFIPTGGATSIKWGVTGGTIGTLCEYTENGTCQDYWGGSSNPRTVNIKATSTQVKATFSTANLDYAYIYDNTNGRYLWKGSRVE